MSSWHEGPADALMARDKVFDEPTERVDDFEFDPKVVSVFDDMVSRSVPFYGEIQRMIVELAADFATDDSPLYDLGCSTGTTLINLDAALPPSVPLVGVDDSPAMLEKAEAKLQEAGIKRRYELRQGDLNQGLSMTDSPSVVVMCLTLQFIRPLYRATLMHDIYQQMRPNGCLLLVEKVLGEDSLFNRLFIQHYYEMKSRHHYSELEIAQKREALENVLVPYKLSENLALLSGSGFRYSEVFFKWYNFCGVVAVK